jgi:hypothetical protein
MGLVSQLANLDLTVAGMSGDVYTSAVGPTAVTVFVQEIWDGLKESLKNLESAVCNKSVLVQVS